MIEAVRTTASTGVTWAIVVVMSFFTAFLVAATAVADSVQNRQNRRRRMMLLGTSGAAALPSQRISRDMLTEPDESRAPEAVPAGMPSAGQQRMDPANPVPAQRQDSGRQAGYGVRESAVQDAAEAPTEPIPAAGDAMATRGEGSVPEQGAMAEQDPMTEQGSVPQQGPRAEQDPMTEQGSVPQQGPWTEQASVPQQGPRAEQGSVPQQGEVPQQGPMPQSAGARGRHARGRAETAEGAAPAGAPAQAGAPGRHAMPAQRTGESDRAERTFAGPANPDPDEDGQS